MSVNSLLWYYTPELKGVNELVSLKGDEWHHCRNVLRMSPGESIISFDGKGHCFEGIIREEGRSEGKIELVRELTEFFHFPRQQHISIAFAPTKNIDRTEFAVEKLVELGVDEIFFLECENSERSRIRMDRMEKIVISAAKQSRKVNMPSIHDLISPSLLVTKFHNEQPDTQIFCCHLDEGSVPLADNYTPEKNVLLVIGPEGGFSNEETEQLDLRGAKLVTLSPYRLRVETAAITACAAVHLLNHSKQQ